MDAATYMCMVHVEKTTSSEDFRDQLLPKFSKTVPVLKDELKSSLFNLMDYISGNYAICGYETDSQQLYMSGINCWNFKGVLPVTLPSNADIVARTGGDEEAENNGD